MSKLGCLWQSQSSFRWKVVSVLKGQNGGRITQPKTLHVLSTPPVPQPPIRMIILLCS